MTFHSFNFFNIVWSQGNAPYSVGCDIFKRGTLGVPNTVQYRKKNWQKTEKPCQKSTKYRYRIHDLSRLLKVVSISRVCLSQAFMHQQSTSAFVRKREKTLKRMPYQFYHRLTVRICVTVRICLDKRVH